MTSPGATIAPHHQTTSTFDGYNLFVNEQNSNSYRYFQEQHQHQLKKNFQQPVTVIVSNGGCHVNQNARGKQYTSNSSCSIVQTSAINNRHNTSNNISKTNANDRILDTQQEELGKMRERLFRLLSKVPIQVGPAQLESAVCSTKQMQTHLQPPKIISREPLVIKYYKERSLSEILDLHFRCSLVRHNHELGITNNSPANTGSLLQIDNFRVDDLNSSVTQPVFDHSQFADQMHIPATTYGPQYQHHQQVQYVDWQHQPQQQQQQQLEQHQQLHSSSFTWNNSDGMQNGLTSCKQEASPSSTRVISQGCHHLSGGTNSNRQDSSSAQSLGAGKRLAASSKATRPSRLSLAHLKLQPSASLHSNSETATTGSGSSGEICNFSTSRQQHMSHSNGNNNCRQTVHADNSSTLQNDPSRLQYNLYPVDLHLYYPYNNSSSQPTDTGSSLQQQQQLCADQSALLLAFPFEQQVVALEQQHLEDQPVNHYLTNQPLCEDTNYYRANTSYGDYQIEASQQQQMIEHPQVVNGFSELPVYITTSANQPDGSEFCAIQTTQQLN